MNANSSLTRLLKTLPLLAFLFFVGCAASGSRVATLEDQLATKDSTMNDLAQQLEDTESRLAELEGLLKGTESKVNSMQAGLNANNKEPYLKVIVPVLNIRTSPTTANSNVIAKAEQGAYLRKISSVDKDNKWLKVEFLVDNYPYVGYVSNKKDFLKEEYYDPMTFNQVYNRKLVKYLWETEAALEMRAHNFKTLGVYVKTGEDYKPERFLGHLANMLRDHKIYIKPIQDFNINKVTDVCKRHKVQGVMTVQIDASENASPLLDIKLFDQKNIILYSTSVPFQSVSLPSYGTR